MTGSNFSGGISNAGLITAPGGIGIALSGVHTFTAGNISNSGTITAKTGITIAGSTINGAIIDTAISSLQVVASASTTRARS